MHMKIKVFQPHYVILCADVLNIVRLEHFDFHVHRRQLQFLSVPQQKRKDMQKHFEAP
jgi:hypothetical protein